MDINDPIYIEEMQELDNQADEEHDYYRQKSIEEGRKEYIQENAKEILAEILKGIKEEDPETMGFLESILEQHETLDCYMCDLDLWKDVELI